MKAKLDKREFDNKSYVRLKLPIDFEQGLITHINIKKPILNGEFYFFEYKDDSLRDVLQFLKKVLDKFGMDYEYDISIENEIENFRQEQKRFAVFSVKAKKIRDNSFDDTQELMSLFDDFDSIIGLKMTRRLYDLQFLSAFHMAYAVNSMNFSVPGSGKTSIVYAAYTYLKAKGLVDKLLVIGPLSSFKAWEKQYFECFGVEIKSYRYSGVDKDREEKKTHLYSSDSAELNLIYYQGVEGLLNDLNAFMVKHKTMLVVDEAHRIKNSEGKWGSSITKLSELAQSRVALTGTPIPNGYEDIYNLTKFIYPFKYKSILNFHLSQLEELSKNPSYEEEVNTLKANLSPFFMRIRKQDLPNLPNVNEKEIRIPMGSVQEEIYEYVDNLTSKLKFSSSSSYDTDFLLRAMLIRLRQAATNPFLLSLSLEKSIEDDFYDSTTLNPPSKLNEIDDEIFDFDFRKRVAGYYKNELSSKVKYCIERTKEIVSSNNNSKVLIWTVFTENAKYLRRELNKLGIKSELLIGMVETEIREVIIDDFDNPKSTLKVVIANPFTIGESVSLHHGCNYSIYLERDFNCSNFIQSKDRIHRVGSKFPEVHYEYLISEWTVDEAISKSLHKKVSRMTDLIDDEIPFFKLLEDENEEAELIREALELYKKKP